LAVSDYGTFWRTSVVAGPFEDFGIRETNHAGADGAQRQQLGAGYA
jgi:hypothetical protein